MSQLDELWPQLLARGLDVVLDFGFWSRAGNATVALGQPLQSAPTSSLLARLH